MAKKDYVIRVLASPLDVDAASWNTLLASQTPHEAPSPFMRHEYLVAMHASSSAVTKTGWTPRFLTLWQGDMLAGACALYLKTHSYGEYVFDMAWANAYSQHGLAYYPKALIAPPFTPVPGPRLLARNADERLLLAQAAINWCREQKLSSLHLLFGSDADLAACEKAGLMLRHNVQFHWSNRAPGTETDSAQVSASPAGFRDFDDFLMSLNQDKRKKIRQERRKVADAGIRFRWSLGTDISDADWDFFYRCYERTYYEHGNAPYLTRDFFTRMQRSMPGNWLLFVAEHSGPDGGRTAVAASLIAVSETLLGADAQARVAYGRYWGALARVDCLHFEACYYQPLQWCIDHGYQRFEGGAQGEHKMARALLPVKTSSAHWLAHPSFADAVERFLEREGAGIDGYLENLEKRSPLRQGPG
ncbi:MAG: GNAT family N-acetyltransferase [Polaromonas sp.]|nr:GNAT family N-acetyltransferase [Polaromonas sp.]